MASRRCSVPDSRLLGMPAWLYGVLLTMGLAVAVLAAGGGTVTDTTVTTTLPKKTPRPTVVSYPQQQPAAKPSTAAAAESSASTRSKAEAKDPKWSGPVRFADWAPPASGNVRGKTPASSCSNWAVLDAAPGKSLSSFLSAEKWCGVSLTELPSSSAGGNGPKLHFASMDAMADTYPWLVELPADHASRRVAGYLSVLQRSSGAATAVWDVDETIEMTRSKVELPRTAAEVKTTCPVFNPFADFGAPAGSWPRGFPAPLAKAEGCAASKPAATGGAKEALAKDIVIAAAPLSGHGDMDGVYASAGVLPVQFRLPQPMVESLVLSPGSFLPYTTASTLFGQKALWAMLLPASVPSRIAEVWRGYIGQRLLWDTGSKVAAVPPVGSRGAPGSIKGEPSQILGGADVELALATLQEDALWYSRTLALVSFLKSWQGRGASLPARYEELAIALYEAKILGAQDVTLVQNWLTALAALNYPFPAIIKAGGSGGASSSAAGSGGADAAGEGSSCSSTTRVLVTGITGLIGSHVARVLVEKPCYKVYGLVRPRSNMDTLVGVLHKITMVTGDITDGGRMMDVVKEVEPHYIYHFAAQAINGISYANAELTIDANVRGTLNLLEGIRRSGLNVRFLLAGSSTEYGATADDYDGPIPEDAPLRPVTPYGVSKVASEMLANQYHNAFGIHVVTARFFIHVGVGGTDSLAIQQFARQIALAEAGITSPIVEHGNIASARDITDVRDSAPVIVKLAETSPSGESYNVGTGQTISTADLLRLAVEASTINITTRVDPARFRVYDEKVLLADNSKVKSFTGWTPSPDMRETVGQILDHWRRRVNSLYGKSPSGAKPGKKEL